MKTKPELINTVEAAAVIGCTPQSLVNWIGKPNYPQPKETHGLLARRRFYCPVEVAAFAKRWKGEK